METHSAQGSDDAKRAPLIPKSSPVCSYNEWDPLEVLKALDHYINARLLLFLNTGCGWAGYGRLRNTAYSKNE